MSREPIYGKRCKVARKKADKGRGYFDGCRLDEIVLPFELGWNGGGVVFPLEDLSNGIW